jgi:hypothetical protein
MRVDAGATFDPGSVDASLLEELDGEAGRYRDGKVWAEFEDQLDGRGTVRGVECVVAGARR